MVIGYCTQPQTRTNSTCHPQLSLLRSARAQKPLFYANRHKRPSVDRSGSVPLRCETTHHFCTWSQYNQTCHLHTLPSFTAFRCSSSPRPDHKLSTIMPKGAVPVHMLCLCAEGPIH
ncbi:uncharacterized protein YALI1_F15286g [Yarrowia lipolytica]|uniref:Uncharacterized protein n=1 Tax=Yarrowia lipolytica TaxID=4952 RepID=A0A1D8NN13_YARLL|nr:hypothetical protein YALI1_F15286g [Yarrowia lipolytica]